MGNEASSSPTKNTYPTQGMPVSTSENLPIATPASSMDAIYAQDAALAQRLTDEDETSMRAWDEYHEATYQYGAWRARPHLPPLRPPPPVVIHEDPDDIVMVWCLLFWLFFMFAFFFFLCYYP